MNVLERVHGMHIWKSAPTKPHHILWLEMFAFQVSASDIDSGVFGEIVYVIAHGDENGNLTINSTTGHVQTGAILNREGRDEYVLTIEALDGKLFVACRM